MNNQKLKHKIPNTKYQKGITLVALIITIIVLLILAVVAISAVQDGGIVDKAKQARDNYAQAQVKENTLLSEYLNQIEAHSQGSTPEKSDDKISVEDYGKTVEYSKGGVSDWKVFYNEGDTVYIIASYDLSAENIPDKFLGRINTHVGLYWKDKIFSNVTDGRAVISPEVANKYKLSFLNNNGANLENNNIKAVADLLDEEAWTSKFGNASKGIKAIGSPTLEMWVASWNEMGEKYGTDKYVKMYISSNSNGYYVGTEENPTNSYACPNVDYNVFVPELFFQYNGCATCWLASPSADDPDELYVAYACRNAE